MSNRCRADDLRGTPGVAVCVRAEPYAVRVRDRRMCGGRRAVAHPRRTHLNRGDGAWPEAPRSAEADRPVLVLMGGLRAAPALAGNRRRLRG